MTSKIQTLPTEVVHLMAAGEVIDSLAAVVRELAENAIDAGATRLHISLWQHQWRVRVSDNGNGMGLDDLQQAATPHSTSKIYSSHDLWQINSLGFRGEALHSLAQLAQLEICSRSLTAPEGWRVSYDTQGTPNRVEVAAIAPGTVVTVSDLFGNWLPRRASLPNSAQQMRAVQATVHQLALCHPHITWQVEQDDRPWFAIWSSPSALQILPQILRDLQPADLQFLQISFSESTDAIHRVSGASIDHNSIPPSLYLLIGLPDRCHRHRPDWVRVAVNGRMVKLPELEQTILGVFRRALPRDRHPVCFLHLQIAPEQIDWNRHPAKTEIYLQHLETWQERVREAIAQAMQLNTSLPEAAHSHRVGQLLKAAEAQGAYYHSRSVQSVEAEESTEDNPSATTPFHSPGALRAIAQVHNMYILAEHPNGVWLVEQHIAHERVLYEQLCDRWTLVPLEPPIILNQLSSAQIEQLQRLGLTVDCFGEQLWAIRTAPEPLAQRSDCSDALLELSLGGNLEAALVATACRTAIRNGTPLTLTEIQTLLDQWQQTQMPRTCPHGRPIYLKLEESSLSRFFRRHWVIGKSHGI
ncbi:MAG: DNA mismatch repair endonuclease MutL [Oculatellaceae cyanobacterium bins.114]|nr:DNA mismatch repair endonuclease MutL [Oculatellaceae cyanobacterium bins.114]